MEPVEPVTDDGAALRTRKLALLHKLVQMTRTHGVVLPRHYTLDDPVEELQFEVCRQEESIRADKHEEVVKRFLRLVRHIQATATSEQRQQMAAALAKRET
jgi:hypothetical protein